MNETKVAGQVPQGEALTTSERAWLGNLNMLSFATFADFQAKVAETANLPEGKKLEYAKKFNVVTLREALNFENDNFLRLLDQYASRLQDQSSTARIDILRLATDAANQYRGLIVFDVETAFLPKAGPSAYSTLLNTLGLVRIGSDIYQFTESQVKVTKGGDEKKISSLFSMKASDTVQGIEVHNVLVSHMQQGESNGRTENHIRTWSCQETSASNNYRILGYEELYWWGAIGSGFEYWAVATALERRGSFFGGASYADFMAVSGYYRFSNQSSNTGWSAGTYTQIRKIEYQICVGCGAVGITSCNDGSCLSVGSVKCEGGWVGAGNSTSCETTHN